MSVHDIRKRIFTDFTYDIKDIKAYIHYLREVYTDDMMLNMYHSYIKARHSSDKAKESYLTILLCMLYDDDSIIDLSY